MNQSNDTGDKCKYSHSAETRKKMSEAALKRAPHSEETRAKMSQSKIRTFTPEVIEQAWKLLEEGYNIPNAARALNVKSEGLRKAIKRTQKDQSAERLQMVKRRAPYTDKKEKVTREIVEEMLDLYESGFNFTEIGKMYGVHKGTAARRVREIQAE